MSRILTLFFLLFVLSPVCFPTRMALATDNVESVKLAIEDYIRPGFQYFAVAASVQKDAIQKLCKKPGQKALVLARSAFDVTVQAWGRVEFIRAGPLMKNNRLERILFWPDRKGIALRQVRNALIKEDTAILKSEVLSGKSVALQGLGALEYLLFGKDSDSLAKEESYRCQFALAIAVNMRSMASRISSEWSESNGFSDLWLNPGPENNLYRNKKESLSELVGLLAHGFELIRNLRLEPVMVQNKKENTYKRAIFWRSDNFFDVLRANVEGLRRLSSASSLDKLLPAGNHSIEGSIDFEFNNALQSLNDIDQSVEKAIYNARNVAAVDYLSIVLKSLQDLFGGQVADAVGLVTGFSPLDGD